LNSSAFIIVNLFATIIVHFIQYYKITNFFDIIMCKSH